MQFVPLLVLFSAASWAGDAFGTWRVNRVRSTFVGDSQPRSLTLRIEPHAKGEVFTMDRIEPDGRATSSSSILYLDGAAREFRDKECSGTQSSRQVDSRTVEILRKCRSGEWTKLLRRVEPQRKELILEITEERSGGRRFERRIVLEKQF